MIRHALSSKAKALKLWIEGFIHDCRARDLSPHTVEFYCAGLADFERFANEEGADQVTDITADLLRSYLLHLEETGRNPGGRHAKYRAVRAFLHLPPESG